MDSLNPNAPKDSLANVAQRMASDFQQRHSLPAVYQVGAPGRVNFIGEHLDYNDGFVLPFAIDRFVVIVGATDPSFENIEFYSTELNKTLTIPLGQKLYPSPTAWENYIVGVVAGMQDQGIEIPPFKATLASTLPMGGGAFKQCRSGGRRRDVHRSGYRSASGRLGQGAAVPTS